MKLKDIKTVVKQTPATQTVETDEQLIERTVKILNETSNREQLCYTFSVNDPDYYGECNITSFRNDSTKYVRAVNNTVYHDDDGSYYARYKDGVQVYEKMKCRPKYESDFRNDMGIYRDALVKAGIKNFCIRLELTRADF